MEAIIKAYFVPKYVTKEEEALWNLWPIDVTYRLDCRKSHLHKNTLHRFRVLSSRVQVGLGLDSAQWKWTQTQTRLEGWNSWRFEFEFRVVKSRLRLEKLDSRLITRPKTREPCLQPTSSAISLCGILPISRSASMRFLWKGWSAGGIESISKGFYGLKRLYSVSLWWSLEKGIRIGKKEVEKKYSGFNHISRIMNCTIIKTVPK